MVGQSFWLWIGMNTIKGKTEYVMGENAGDLYYAMCAQGLFGERDPYLQMQLKNEEITLEDTGVPINKQAALEEFERGCVMTPNSNEILRIISLETEPQYRQIKLLEIAPDLDKVFDYSLDRDRSRDEELEVAPDMVYQIVFMYGNQISTDTVRGPYAAFSMVFRRIEDEDLKWSVMKDDFLFHLRYLQTGKGLSLYFENAAILISALGTMEEAESNAGGG